MPSAKSVSMTAYLLSPYMSLTGVGCALPSRMTHTMVPWPLSSTTATGMRFNGDWRVSGVFKIRLTVAPNGQLAASPKSKYRARHTRVAGSAAPVTSRSVVWAVVVFVFYLSRRREK